MCKCGNKQIVDLIKRVEELDRQIKILEQRTRPKHIGSLDTRAVYGDLYGQPSYLENK
jgi:hypothetical protein